MPVPLNIPYNYTVTTSDWSPKTQHANACKGKTSVKETEFNLKGDKRNIFFAVEFACFQGYCLGVQFYVN